MPKDEVYSFIQNYKTIITQHYHLQYKSHKGLYLSYLTLIQIQLTGCLQILQNEIPRVFLVFQTL